MNVNNNEMFDERGIQAQVNRKAVMNDKEMFD